MTEWDVTISHEGREKIERYRLPDNVNLSKLKERLKAEDKVFLAAKNLIPMKDRKL